MPKRDLFLHRRQSKKREPEQLYNTLCGMYPQYMAEEYFKKLMGYDPRKRFRVPELKDYLDITISEERR